MAERHRIGIIFSYEEKWIGGTYYCLNIINALNCLPYDSKPVIVAFINSRRDEEVLLETLYPFLKIYPLEIKSGFINKLDLAITKLSGKRIKPLDIWRNAKVDSVYLFRHNIPYFKAVKNKIFWVADFQEFVLREYFTEKEYKTRSALPRYVSKTTYTLVVSSEDSKRDFEKFFPDHTCRVRVARFASMHPDLSDLSIERIKEKYDITKPYFLCANQFWQHKNHGIILRALTTLPKSDLDKFQVMWTGKNFDYRKSDYFSDLEKLIQEKELGAVVNYIGFIDRREQLLLMQHAISVIQPSLFEGWSTTVEDAKHLGQRVLLSDISVHKEQKDANGLLFERNNEHDLATKMIGVLEGKYELMPTDYTKNIEEFGRSFLNAIVNE